MSTKSIKKKTIKNNGKKKIPIVASSTTSIQEGEFKKVEISDIDFSPFNYRKYFSEKSLEDFAAELSLHGIISPLTLRQMPTDRYELVAGERRLRAAKIAGLKEVPATIKVLSDDEVVEIQLAENLQREDPHPMDEAQAIGQMQKAHKSIDEIAARLGKSKTFVFSRIKLLSLTDSFQEMFLADKINIQEALEISTLSAQSQQDFFDEYCKEWKEKKNFELCNLDYALRRFKYDLRHAPFDTKDKNLLPEIGACTRCPFNTATLKTLFPEHAKEAVCTNRECYTKKCSTHLSNHFIKAFEELKPDALLISGELSDFLENIIQSVPDAGELPKYDRYQITVFRAPEMPDKEEFRSNWETEECEVPEFDEEGFNQAMEEYNTELEEFNLLQQNGKALKGIFVTERGIVQVLFSDKVPENNNNHKTVTAKEVQSAIKAGTATQELLEAEIDRINSREARSIELDREKVQLKVYEAFIELIQNENTSIAPTDADQVAVRLIIYQSLDYSTKHKVSEVFFSNEEDSESNENENLYQSLANLTDEQFGYLIRVAVACNSESKSPRFEKGYFLYQMAGSIGVDIAGIEKQQEQKANARKEKQEEKIEALQKKISKMKKTE